MLTTAVSNLRGGLVPSPGSSFRYEYGEALVMLDLAV